MNNSLSKIINRIEDNNSKKLYQIWKGRNKFCLQGKIYIGSEFYYGLLSAIYIGLNSSFFLLFIITVSIINYFIQEN